MRSIVCQRTVFKYLIDYLLVFSEILHEDGSQSKNNDMAGILNENILGLREIQCQKLSFLGIFSEATSQKCLILYLMVI